MLRAERSSATVLRFVAAATFVLVSGCAEDFVDGPIVTDVELESVECAPPSAATECYTLRARVRGRGGPVDARCRVVALADDYSTELALGATETIPSVAPGDTLAIEVRVNAVDSPRFLRWQPMCEPGPPG